MKVFVALLSVAVLIAVGRGALRQVERNPIPVRGLAVAIWPTWTPRPTATVPVYPSWTPQPTATSRWSATPTRTVTPGSVTATYTPSYPTLTATPMETLLPPVTQVPCGFPWPFTSGERLRIQGAATWHLGKGAEIDLIPAQDALCGIGMYQYDLGAPMSIAFAVEGDQRGDVIRCRAFALGLVAIMERPDMDSPGLHYAVLRWSGETRE